MSDIWDGLGADIQRSHSEPSWLYRIGTDTHGPVPQHTLGEKWIAGEVHAQTPVARQDTDFAPLGQVAAFASVRQAAEDAALQRKAKATRRKIVIALTLWATLAAGAAWQIRREYRHRVTQLQQEQLRQQNAAAAAALAQAQKQAEIAHQAQNARAAAHAMKLVAPISLGAVQDITITQASHALGAGRRAKQHRQTKTPHLHHNAAAAAAAAEEKDSFIESCQLTQQDIFTTLRAQLAKLNVCVEDEKHRDVAHLLPQTLDLQFVVKTDGKVTEFVINDRHLRSGPLNNCLVKAFKTIKFPTSQGANCPVTIPIKIGS